MTDAEAIVNILAAHGKLVAPLTLTPMNHADPPFSTDAASGVQVAHLWRLLRIRSRADDADPDCGDGGWQKMTLRLPHSSMPPEDSHIARNLVSPSQQPVVAEGGIATGEESAVVPCTVSFYYHVRSGACQWATPALVQPSSLASSSPATHMPPNYTHSDDRSILADSQSRTIATAAVTAPPPQRGGTGEAVEGSPAVARAAWVAGTAVSPVAPHGQPSSSSSSSLSFSSQQAARALTASDAHTPTSPRADTIELDAHRLVWDAWDIVLAPTGEILFAVDWGTARVQFDLQTLSNSMSDTAEYRGTGSGMSGMRGTSGIHELLEREARCWYVLHATAHASAGGGARAGVRGGDEDDDSEEDGDRRGTDKRETAALFGVSGAVEKRPPTAMVAGNQATHRLHLWMFLCRHAERGNVRGPWQSMTAGTITSDPSKRGSLLFYVNLISGLCQWDPPAEFVVDTHEAVLGVGKGMIIVGRRPYINPAGESRRQWAIPAFNPFTISRVAAASDAASDAAGRTFGVVVEGQESGAGCSFGRFGGLGGVSRTESERWTEDNFGRGDANNNNTNHYDSGNDNNDDDEGKLKPHDPSMLALSPSLDDGAWQPITSPAGHVLFRFNWASAASVWLDADFGSIGHSEGEDAANKTEGGRKKGATGVEGSWLTDFGDGAVSVQHTNGLFRQAHQRALHEMQVRAYVIFSVAKYNWFSLVTLIPWYPKYLFNDTT